MTVLTVAQGACPFIGVDVPDGVMSSTVREHVELKAVIQEMAKRIAKSHTWNLLQTLATYTGDGSEEDFDLPTDFDWMPDDTRLWTSTSQQPLAKVQTLDQWLGLTVQGIESAPPVWIMYGGQIHIKSALPNAETAKHFYQSNLINDPASGSNSAAFTLDTDTFRLSEELLRLGVIFRWKQLKSQPYAEEMNDYEVLKEQLIARDKGPAVLVQGSMRVPKGARVAYPLNVPIS